MFHLSNPLVTTTQLYDSITINALPIELQDSIRFYTARLTQAAGLLLRLPQSITAQANVLLFRYWVVDNLMRFEFADVSASVLYLTAKISASPRSLRSITNVYAYLLSPLSPLSSFGTTKADTSPDPDSYYLSESAYILSRQIILHIEGQILCALGFETHVSLPHPLCITYLQTLGVFLSEEGERVAKKAIRYLNTALLSPQGLYLTHQPNVLATAACYLACRGEGVRLPGVEWWEVFDCEREELGFVVVGMGSLEGVVGREVERWGIREGRGRGRGMVTVEDVKGEVKRLRDIGLGVES